VTSPRVLSLAAVTTLTLCSTLQATGLAQRPTGSIVAQVNDLTGGALAGATVVLNSPSLITPNLTSVTDERGESRVQLLEPGVYDVRIEADGYAPFIRENLRLVAGMTIRLTFTLQPAIAQAVVVVAESPVVDRVTTTSGEVYTRDVLETIPNSRFFGDVFNQAPGITDNSARGSSVRGNAYRLDGVDITDPVVGTPFAFFNYDIFDEIQVQTGGRTAEYGQATGAVVNLVTKSGGNRRSGIASFYFVDHALNSTNGESITERFPALRTGRFLSLLNPQAQLGGAIVEDRIWYFGAYQYTKSETTQPGFSDALGQAIPRRSEWHYTYGKLTSQLNPNHRLIVGLNANTFSDDNRGAGALTPPESTSLEESGAWTTHAEWTGSFRRLLPQVRYTRVDQHFDLLPKNAQPRCQNVTTGEAGCSAGFIDLNRRDRGQIHGVLSLAGSLGGFHAVRLGGEHESSGNWRDLTYNQGLWFNVVEDALGRPAPATVWTFQDPPTEEALTRFSVFAQDSWNVTPRTTLNLGIRLDRTEGWFPEQSLPDGGRQPELRDVVAHTAVSPRLGVSFDPSGSGRSVVRASYSRYAGGLITAYFFRVNGNALAGQLHAHCSGLLGNLCAPGDGELSTVLLSTFGPVSTDIDPGLALPKTNELAVGFETELAPSMSLAVNYVHKREFDLIEDAETARTFIGRAVHDAGDTEIDEEGRVVGAIPPQSFTIYDPDFRTATRVLITNPAGAERDYDALELSVTRRWSGRWQMHASFVASRSRGLVGTSFFGSSSSTSLFNTPNALINADGALDLDRTHVLKVLGTYLLPYDISVSGLYRAMSGLPYNRTAVFSSYDANGDGVNDTPLVGGAVSINAEPPGSRRLDPLHILDLGVEKTLVFPGSRFGLRLDVYNLFNIDTVLSRRTQTSSAGSFGEPLAFVGARGMRLSARFTF
jgi:outer membrane receptor protein involved in Fe transport